MHFQLIKVDSSEDLQMFVYRGLIKTNFKNRQKHLKVFTH